MSDITLVVDDADAGLRDRVALSTHSFQAPGFYARLGYIECGRARPDTRMGTMTSTW